MILDPAPSIDYFVAVTDTESSSKLTTRVYTITHTVPLKLSSSDDVISVICRASQDKTAGSTKIYGYDLIAKTPSTSWNDITNQAVAVNVISTLLLID